MNLKVLWADVFDTIDNLQCQVIDLKLDTVQACEDIMENVVIHINNCLNSITKEVSDLGTLATASMEQAQNQFHLIHEELKDMAHEINDLKECQSNSSQYFRKTTKRESPNPVTQQGVAEGKKPMGKHQGEKSLPQMQDQDTDAEEQQPQDSKKPWEETKPRFLQ